MADLRHTRTERLLLDAAVEDDVDDLFAIHGDPEVWRHFLSGRHTDRVQSVAMVLAGGAAARSPGSSDRAARRELVGLL